MRARQATNNLAGDGIEPIEDISTKRLQGQEFFNKLIDYSVTAHGVYKKYVG